MPNLTIFLAFHNVHNGFMPCYDSSPEGALSTLETSVSDISLSSVSLTEASWDTSVRKDFTVTFTHQGGCVWSAQILTVFSRVSPKYVINTNTYLNNIVTDSSKYSASCLPHGYFFFKINPTLILHSNTYSLSFVKLTHVPCTCSADSEQFFHRVYVMWWKVKGEKLRKARLRTTVCRGHEGCEERTLW